MAKRGYSVEWRLYNSKNYGVPQNRERIYLIGHLGRITDGEILPKARDGRKTLEKCNGLNEKVSQSDRIYNSTGISSTLTSSGGGNGSKTGLYAIDLVNRGAINSQRDRVYATTGIIGALTATDYKQPPSIAVDSNKKYIVDGIEYPNTCKLKNGRVVTVRRLTPRECFRLQGFTDEQYDKIPPTISDTQRYKQAGNSVTIPLVKEIGEAIVNYAERINR